MQPLPSITNLFDRKASDHEQFFELLHAQSAKLEHIISYGEASPVDFWYDQEQDEWVALIKGSALLEFESGSLMLVAGDALTIPAHMKHRVASVSNDAVWLALHYSPSKQTNHDPLPTSHS